jgi:DNA repair protein SbcD/Mre11
VKMIHTADWHLCDRLGRIDRTDDLHTRVERVAQLCQERDADVLLIAGDVFSEQASVDDMTRALTRLREAFAPFFARGGTILALTGNHDRDGRINMVRAGMTLAAPAAGRNGLLEGGRMYLLNGRAVARLSAADGGLVQFVLIPYPFASRYDISAAEYRTKEEENRLLHGRIAEWVQGLPNRPDFDPQLPTVLAAHLHVRGAELGGPSKYVLTERDDVQFDFADLNPGWAYIALGHVHKPQALKGQANVRYCGSMDRLDFGEMHDDHGVLFVEVGRTGLMREPEQLPIAATPFHTIALTDPETELPALAGRYPDRETAIVRVTVSPSAAGPSRDEIARQVRRLFPRLHELKWADKPRGDEAGEQETFTPRADFAATVRDYLTKRLTDDPDKEAVLALTDGFLGVEGEA